jgi:hypothetical protein
MRNSEFGRTVLLGITAAGLVGLLAAALPATTLALGAAVLLDPTYVATQVCGGMQRKAEFFKPGALIATAQAAGAAAAERTPELRADLGTLAVPVTTRTPAAQAYFDQGMRWAYAFNHGEAARAFQACQKADPTCAMCYWGEAYVLGPNINYPMQPQAVAPAFGAAAQAMALRDRGKDRERALIEAVAARYSPDPTADRRALDLAYAEAMAQVAARFPADDEVQVLFADSLMNLQPWDYWEPDK